MSEKIRVMITEEEIDRRTREIAEMITRDYAGRTVHMVTVLKGGVYFMTMLSKRIAESVPVELDFMSVSSYGADTKSSGVVRIVKDLDEPLLGKDVLVVEDIIDSGRTLSYLVEYLKLNGARSVKTVALLDKPSRREVDYKPDYTGLEIPDEFVIGYGLDYAEKYRSLPYVGILKREVYMK